MRRALLFLPLLLTWARAGGAEPIARADVLRWVPGVRQAVFTPPSPTRQEPFTSKLTVQVGRLPVQVFLSAGGDANEAQPGRITGLLAWVPTATPGPAEKEALVRVVLTHLRVCASVTETQAAQIRLLAGLDWQAPLGMQERQVGPFQLSWADGDGLNVAGRDRGGMIVRWPGAPSRCTF
ncbi:hypothetical protein [Deinococcus aquaedulcis]|uniref:hypothetical protein n=1 Tax=Deinococcus aquaedulcis TaxID=2840455 RepID=UPI001C83B378|nr:hypothetical protein [Deinococcus aquaedulcis]